ncbi:MAG: glycine cleavage system aminomethyltransferase GcvT [bacterium]
MKTPLYDNHVALGARMAAFGGWDMPIQYEGILTEHERTRTRATIFDICHMGEFDLRGPTAETDLERLLTMNVASIRTGQCRYGYLLREDGSPLDDLTCYRRANDHFMLVVNAGTHEGDAAWITSQLSPGTTFTDISPTTGKLDIQGPTSRADMERAFGVHLPDLTYFGFTDIALLGSPCTLSRTGYTGEWGYELYMPRAETRRFWDMLLAKGDIKPGGLGCRDTLRLEVGYPLYGHELGPGRTPVAAARGAFLDTKKEFIGRAACVHDLEKGCPRYLAGLKLASRRAARAHDRVELDGKAVGEITSGSLAPSLGVAVALAYLDAPLCQAGQAVRIPVQGGKSLNATVVELPFYKNGTARRSTTEHTETHGKKT